MFLDLGPVFGEWEADVGRTYVTGDDPEKQRLCRDLPRQVDVLKQQFDQNPDVAGAELYAFAALRGCGGLVVRRRHSRPIVAEFPHARIPGTRTCTGSAPPIRASARP